MLLVNKTNAQFLEWYYEIPMPDNFLIQYIYLNKSETKEILNECLHIYENPRFIDEKEDEYDTHCNLDTFEYLSFSSFYHFFTFNSVDIPSFFKNIKSTKRTINEINILKFNNYFMRRGLRYKSLYLINTALNNLGSDFLTIKNLSTLSYINWKDFFLIFGSLNIRNNHAQFEFENDEFINYGNMQTSLYKNILTQWDNKKILFSNLHELLPMFSFYIYKVDKQIYKNTRGKSGKYTFIWKYVAQYKRKFLVMFWLMRELRITNGRSILERLTLLLRTFIFNPRQTWIFKVKKFSHNYVYRNCRNTLAENYRTTTK